jgi:hypothetical protein
MDYTIVVAAPASTRRRSSTSRPTPAAPWPSTSCTPRTRTARARRRSASTTTSPSRPSRTARCRWCCAARRGARRTRATSSTCTRACSSARQALRRDGRRLAHRAPDHRDAGRRRVGVHPDQRDLHHRRADLPRVRPLLLRRAPGRERRHLGVARGWRGADQGDEEGGRQAQGRAGAVPRARGLRRLRLRAGRGDAAAARARQRSVEVLKQGQYSPMPVEHQVAIIYALTNGYLDGVDLPQVRVWERDFHVYLRTQHAGVLDGDPHERRSPKETRRRSKRDRAVRRAVRRPANSPVGTDNFADSAILQETDADRRMSEEQLRMAQRPRPTRVRRGRATAACAGARRAGATRTLAPAAPAPSHSI